ncbi:MAG: hypothetical protein FWC57_05360, partial [Endomicrobia bacterium]|nr:hypothetical protein [Endomicrobiia bacterium]
LLKMLLEIYDAKNDNVKGIFEEKKYAPRDIKKEMFAIERWLMEVVYDAGKKTFNTGANENGVDKTDALDAVSWTILALDPVRLTEMGVDPFVMMQFADKNFLVEDNLGDSGFPVKGYDFTNKEGRRKDYRMVWFEGTGFHIAAMQAMSKYSEENGYAKRAPYFRQQAMYFLNEMSKASEKCALIDGSLPYTSKKPKEREIFTTFYYEWEIPRGRKGQWVSSASSTAWRIIAMSAFNPMSFDKKNVNYKLFK